MLNLLKLFSLLFLLGAPWSAIAKKDKDGDGKLAKKSLKNIATCFGKPLDLSSQLTSVEECLIKRLAEALEKASSDDDGESSKKKDKKEKKKSKLTEKVNKKCLAECEWNALGLNVGASKSPNSTNGSSTTAIETVLKVFPSEAHDSIRSAIGLCFTSTVESTKDKPCSKSKKLTKCLGKAVRQTCKTAGSQDTTASTQDEVSDDSDDDSDDSDDEDSTNEEEKSGTPSTMIDTSERITK